MPKASFRLISRRIAHTTTGVSSYPASAKGIRDTARRVGRLQDSLLQTKSRKRDSRVIGVNAPEPSAMAKRLVFLTVLLV
jgi:hypothetical protein